MRPYTPATNKGRHIGGHDIHHRTADMPRNAAKLAAKRQRHAARQAGKTEAADGVREKEPKGCEEPQQEKQP